MTRLLIILTILLISLSPAALAMNVAPETAKATFAVY